MRGSIFKPPAPRHFEIKQDDVDPNVRKRIDRIFGSSRQGRDLEPAVGFHHAREHGARHHRIVNDHEPDATPADPSD